METVSSDISDIHQSGIKHAPIAFKTKELYMNMFDNIITRWTEFCNRYPLLAYTDVVTIIAIIAYTVLA